MSHLGPVDLICYFVYLTHPWVHSGLFFAMDKPTQVVNGQSGHSAQESCRSGRSIREPVNFQRKIPEWKSRNVFIFFLNISGLQVINGTLGFHRSTYAIPRSFLAYQASF